VVATRPRLKAELRTQGMSQTGCMVAMHSKERKETFHEPDLSQVMVPIHVEKLILLKPEL